MNREIEPMEEPGALPEGAEQRPNHRDGPPDRVGDRDVQVEIGFGPKRGEARQGHSAQVGVVEEVAVVVEADEVGEENRRKRQRRQREEKRQHARGLAVFFAAAPTSAGTACPVEAQNAIVSLELDDVLVGLLARIRAALENVGPCHQRPSRPPIGYWPFPGEHHLVAIDVSRVLKVDAFAGEEVRRESPVVP